jgi:hypothetical protein
MTAVLDGRTAAVPADAAADAVRAINHITGWPRGLVYPSETYRVLGQLATVAARLPQACEQIARKLAIWRDAGHLGIDPGTRHVGDPAAAVRAATTGLDDAATTAARLSEAQHEAAAALAYAHYTGPDLDDVQETN